MPRLSTVPSPPRIPVLACAAGALLALAGCGAGDPKPGPEVAGGNAGIDEAVTPELKVLDVELEYPLDGRYDVGDDPSLYVAISNTGSASDTLVDVTGPGFADVHQASGAGVSIAVPGKDTVFVGAEDEPALTLLDLATPLRPSQHLPVTFVFERAGAVTVDAVVDAQGQRPLADVDFPDPAGDA